MKVVPPAQQEILDPPRLYLPDKSEHESYVFILCFPSLNDQQYPFFLAMSLSLFHLVGVNRTLDCDASRCYLAMDLEKV